MENHTNVRQDYFHSTKFKNVPRKKWNKILVEQMIHSHDLFSLRVPFFLFPIHREEKNGWQITGTLVESQLYTWKIAGRSNEFRYRWKNIFFERPLNRTSGIRSIKRGALFSDEWTIFQSARFVTKQFFFFLNRASRTVTFRDEIFQIHLQKFQPSINRVPRVHS